MILTPGFGRAKEMSEIFTPLMVNDYMILLPPISQDLIHSILRNTVLPGQIRYAHARSIPCPDFGIAIYLLGSVWRLW